MNLSMNAQAIGVQALYTPVHHEFLSCDMEHGGICRCSLRVFDGDTECIPGLAFTRSKSASYRPDSLLLQRRTGSKTGSFNKKIHVQSSAKRHADILTHMFYFHGLREYDV